MNPDSTKRNISELPSLKKFRTFCLICISVLLVVLLVLSAITVVPQIEWLIATAMLLTGIVSLYFFIIGLRTQVIIYQLRHNQPQIFDRSAPEWITLAFLVICAVVLLWPHSQ